MKIIKDTFKYISIGGLVIICSFLCQCSNNNQSKDNDRRDYVQRAREQDSLRIAYHQDSLEKAEQFAVAQREREELLRTQAEQVAIERKQQEEANRQNEILAQKKRIQEKEYRDNLVEEIDTVYTRVSKPTGGGMLAVMYMKMARKKISL